MNPLDFINLIAPMAVEDMKKTNVLASITIAQGALESNWGASAPNNNLFGIKGVGSLQTTQEFYNGQWVTVIDGFRSYDTWYGSIVDHSKFLIVNPRYRKYGFFDCCANKDYKGAARALQAAKYATDPNYANKLIRIIEKYGLHKFDVVEDEEDMKLDDNVTDYILDVLSDYWYRMEGNKEVQDYTHDVANALRRAVGREEE